MSDVKRIGVMMQLDRPFKRHVSTYSGILEYARKHPEWRVVVDEWADRSLPAKRGTQAPYDGIIGRIGKLGAERARRLDLPAVNVWFSSPAHGLPGVFPDFVASGRLVADHLLGRGFRHLAALLQAGDKGAAGQASGMEAFAREAGVDGWLGNVVLDEPATYDDWRRGVQAIERWMSSWKVPLGLLVLDPSWVRVIVEQAKERGWRVPDQIAIVCSTNDELHCEQPEPGLSAVELPFEQIGFEAARMLDELIDGKREGRSPFAEPKTVILPPVGIVSRHSTDFFAVEDPLVGQALRYIAGHLHKPLDVTTVAKAIGAARRTLDAWFEKSLGVTVAVEISRLRIERVKRELAAGQDSIEAIARRTGFASTRTLNDQFKRSTGMTPTAFREQGQT